MKTDVYSWRVSPDLKIGLEREARRRKISMAAALDLAAREWLGKSGAADEEEKEQVRLRRSASKLLGALAGGDPRRSEKASQTIRQRPQRRYGR
ncbi:MAG TPA: hypothetical protein VG675_25290 [Bryobacteraceae bacterium]|nr:hypothetical protein [Bryobacteraceae bacterium]